MKRTGETGVEETILEGHLGVTKELLAFQTPEKKYYIGCEKGGANLIKVSRCTHTPTVCSGKAVENTAVVQCRVSPSLGMSGRCGGVFGHALGSISGSMLYFLTANSMTSSGEHDHIPVLMLAVEAS